MPHHPQDDAYEHSEPPDISIDDDPLRTSLRIAVETLTRLEQDVQEAQALIRQLAGHLLERSGALGDVSPGIVRLPHALPTGPEPAVSRERPSELRIQCLGPFEVQRNDEYLALRAGKAAEILKFLALRPQQPVPRDVLLEAIWPETNPGIANNRLKVAMHHLRQAFIGQGCSPRCEGCVVFRDGCYLFNPRINVCTDIQDFEQAWQSGARLERTGRQAEAISCYLKAESLYRGDLLEEDLYREWTLVRREELKDSYLTILDKLSRYWLQIGNLDQAIDGWKKILARDPWREDIYRRVMACNAYRGQRGLALRWYETCAQALQTELNVGPEPETVALQQCILAGQDVSPWIHA